MFSWGRFSYLYFRVKETEASRNELNYPRSPRDRLGIFWLKRPWFFHQLCASVLSIVKMWTSMWPCHCLDLVSNDFLRSIKQTQMKGFLQVQGSLRYLPNGTEHIPYKNSVQFLSHCLAYHRCPWMLQVESHGSVFVVI